MEVKKLAILYNVKVLFSGNVIEVYRYEETRSVGYSIKERGLSNSDDEINYETGEIITKEDRRLQSRKASNIRARNNLRRLITTNFNKNSKFLTLTFKENVQDVELANEIFKRFIFNLNRYLNKVNKPSLSYVAVIEFQDGERRGDKIGRGAIHYHLVCDLKGVGANTIRKYWLNATKELKGNIDIKNIRHVDNVGAYLVKYMTKGNADKRLIGKKLYQTSRGLEKPKELGLAMWKPKDRLILEDLLKGKKITYSSDYEDKHTGGTVNFQEINLSRQ